jgi:hypothetical protein
VTIARRIAALTLVLATALAACGGDDDDDAGGLTQDDIVTALTDEGVPEDIADCMATTIEDEVGADGLAEISASDLQADDPPSEEFADALEVATSECVIGDLEIDDDAANDEPTGMEEGDVAATMTEEICGLWADWRQTGDEADLVDLDEPLGELGRDDLVDAVRELKDFGATDTAEQQQEYEGIVDFIHSELTLGGCLVD